MAEVKARNFTEDDAPPSSGLRDAGHVILRCSACGEPLVDVWLTDPDAVNPMTGGPFTWKGKALCCFCGDSSFPVEWKGRYAVGPYGVDVADPDPDNADDSKMRLSITKIEPRGDLLVFHTKKKQ